MLGYNDISLKQTRYYQDAYAEGQQEEYISLVMRLLKLKFGIQIQLD